MIVGRLHPDGSLTDMADRTTLTYGDGSVDVALSVMPTDGGFYYTYDAVNKLAVPADPTPLLRLQATALTTDPVPIMKVMRAVLLMAMDELNILRQRDVDRAADVAASTSLADLKTRWAARSALAQRTVAQAKTAVANRINTTDADQ